MAEVGWQIVACILAADFLTGVVHWVEDCYGLPTWLVVGRTVVAPNIRHHLDQANMVRSSFLGRCGDAIAVAALICTALWVNGWLCWQFALVAAVTSVGNETHYWSHVRPRHAWARVLQDAGLAISPHQHARHHRRPFDRYYCTVTNFVNALLEPLRFWPRLEWLVARLGVPPKRMTPERSGV